MLINNDEYLAILSDACEFIKKAQYNAIIGANYAQIKRNYRDCIGRLFKKILFMWTNKEQ